MALVAGADYLDLQAILATNERPSTIKKIPIP
jgi:hypothetical protein